MIILIRSRRSIILIRFFLDHFIFFLSWFNFFFHNLWLRCDDRLLEYMFAGLALISLQLVCLGAKLWFGGCGDLFWMVGIGEIWRWDNLCVYLLWLLNRQSGLDDGFRR